MIENYLVIDTFIVRGIQSTNLHNQVKPISLDIGKSSKFNDIFMKYSNKRFIYRFQLISIRLSTNMTNTDGEILVTCKGLRMLRNVTLAGRKTQSLV